jgi:queuine tRNA-ribosyltransferase
MNSITIKGKTYRLPIYLPDGTRAVVRTLDSDDLKSTGIEGMVVNTYHLMTQPGTSILDAAGGVKKFMNWDGFVVSDSGGFQVLSLIHQHPNFGKINDEEVVFYTSSKGEKRKYHFTPEKSIQVQFSIGSDVIVCLDDCPNLNAKDNELEIAVNRTIAWAKRCKEEFERQIKQRGMDDTTRPKLMAVVQGGENPDLRKYCADELLKIGFDLYGYGGFPMDENGKFRYNTLKLVSDLLPGNVVKFALGVGTPQDIVDGYKMGYRIFDCVLPTRDARHKRLYNFIKDPDTIDILNEPKIFEFFDIGKDANARDFSPISKYCDCTTCQKYTRSYLYHLFKIEEFTAGRLASIHNLRTYSRLVEILRKLEE